MGPQLGTGLEAGGPVRFCCDCGSESPASSTASVCACGATGMACIDGVLVKDSLLRAELQQPDETNRHFIAECERIGWRSACEAMNPAACANEGQRYSVANLVPIPDGSPILDVNPGYGHIAAQFARSYRVVALAATAEQARFLAVRKRQDQLDQLVIVLGGLASAGFSAAQFAAVTGMPPPNLVSAAAFRGFLEQVLPLLAKDGFLYLSLPNRYAWRQLRRAGRDTGAWRRGYFGYRRLFGRAGLQIVSAWMAAPGYDTPCLLVPFQRQAMMYYERRWNYGGQSMRDRMAHGVRELLAIPWLWRLAESDYVFLLRAADA